MAPSAGSRVKHVIVTAFVMIAAAQQPVFRSTIDVVRLDVSVMNGLAPVTGLTRDQFVVVDNGVPQTIDSVLL